MSLLLHKNKVINGIKQILKYENSLRTIHRMNCYSCQQRFISVLSSPKLTTSTSLTTPTIRWSSSSAAAKGGRDGEAQIKSVLVKAFPVAQNINVEDISGGCGSMYRVFIESKDFEGISIVKQHQLVNKALKDEIKDMHGIRIETQVPKH